jgi:non-specific serine/threonine protein kinase/serine/threonine-protein kinase
MGEVFRAERADELFTQVVAVKLTRSTISHSESRRRFHQERQILAALHHEHIVRLLDGGTLATGQAFLIMEHVEGVPLTTYCRDQALSLEARLALFAKVCAAVHYAHQHGVVHRDLKPVNVLVDSDGVPKVVDFGIAKLLERDNTTGFTSTGMPAPLTPNYASPEQIRGLPVTAASDVYSLGVVLYEVVAGVKPYETEGQTLERVLAIVAHEPPLNPSARRPIAAALPYPRARLAGDIDAIVLKALRKEPADRYGSASELASDLVRYLAGDPVQARMPTTGYLLRRLIGRHKRLAAVAASTLLAILAASGIAIWQWQAARRAQARAEQRFNEVRQLANALIFKIHDAVVPLAGSTPVRRTIVEEAIGYLERLEAEVGDDAALRLELAAAYRQIGTILGSTGRANLGDREGAIRHYERARALVAAAARPEEATYDVAASLVSANSTLIMLYHGKGDEQRAVQVARDSQEFVTRYRQTHPRDPRVEKLLGRTYFGHASVLPDPESIPAWQRTLDHYEGLLAAAPNDADYQRSVALTAKTLGAKLESIDAAAADKHHRRALLLDEARLARAPGDRTAQLDTAISLARVAQSADALGERDTAARLFRRSLALRRTLAETDPADVQATDRLANLLHRMARFYRRQGDVDEARSAAHEALDILQLLHEQTRDRLTRRELAFAWSELGLAESTAGRRREACAAFNQAHALYSDSSDNLAEFGPAEAVLAAREAVLCVSQHAGR